MASLEELVRPGVYPRSSRYDPAWLVRLDMGPNPLWLLEDLCSDLELRPGMRVLDLGSGMGATSVFLAREFDAEVFATDLWVPADEAAAVFAEAGVGDRVHAIHAEAHALPFARDHFALITCIDSYEYFGTDVRYLGYITGFLKPGGQLGVATAAMKREPSDLGGIPDHIRACIDGEAAAWHTAEWGRFHWEVTELVTDVTARLQPSAWHDWLLWSRVCRDNGSAHPEMVESSIEMLEADGGELLSFALLTARRR